MTIDITPFRVPRGARVKLSEWPTRVRPLSKSKSEYRRGLADLKMRHPRPSAAQRKAFPAIRRQLAR
jgi:hypothetical protein